MWQPLNLIVWSCARLPGFRTGRTSVALESGNCRWEMNRASAYFKTLEASPLITEFVHVFDILSVNLQTVNRIDHIHG
jgi:hypothetical protein